MTEDVCRALRFFYAKCLSVITGRKIQEIRQGHMADEIVGMAELRRAGFAGHTLRLGDERMVKRMMIESRVQREKEEGSLLCRFPGTFEQAEALAQDRSAWRDFWRSHESLSEQYQPSPVGDGN